MNNRAKKYCKNCYFPISEYAKFCPQCRQKNTTGKIPAIDFLKDFFSNILNVDSKIFLTIFALFVPGKLTVEYFNGKHQSYANPVQLFLFTGITLFAVVAAKTSDIEIGNSQISYVKRAEHIRANKIIRDQLDTFKVTFQKPSEYHQTDSLYELISKKIGRPANDSVTMINILQLNEKIRLSYHDLVETPIDTLLKIHDIKSGLASIVMAQQIKAMKNGKGWFHYMLGKLPIIIFIMMPFLALVLKLLYVRNKRYFVEHLVFSFHYHTFAFVVILLILLLSQHLKGWMLAGLILSIFIYLLLAMRRFYQQGFFKTIFKFFALNFTYLFLVGFFGSAAAILSFLLF